MQSRKHSIMHVQKLCNLSCSSLSFFGLWSPLSLSLNFIVACFFVIGSPKWSCQFWAGTERFWEGEKHCTTVTHLFTLLGARQVGLLRNARIWRQRSSSEVPQGKEALLWIIPEIGMGGPTHHRRGKQLCTGTGGTTRGWRKPHGSWAKLRDLSLC